MSNHSIITHLSLHARILVAAQAARPTHPLRQLRSYLPGRAIELVEAAALAELAPQAELLIWLADSPGGLPPEFGALEPLPSEDAFILRTGLLHGRPALLALGGGLPGLIHAVNELGLRQLVTPEESIEIPELDIRQSPALPYRLLWSWDHSTNWYLEWSVSRVNRGYGGVCQQASVNFFQPGGRSAGASQQ